MYWCVLEGGIKNYFIVKSNLKTPLSLLDTHFLKAYFKFSFFNISNISILGDRSVCETDKGELI